MAAALERAVARFRRRPPDGDPSAPSRRVTAAEFRATTEQRLRGLERELAEIKRRVNGLIFTLAGAVAAQIVLRLIE
jgi:hypothetical protein